MMKAIYRVKLLSEYFDFDFASGAAEFLKTAVTHTEDKRLTEFYRIEVYLVEKDGEEDADES